MRRACVGVPTQARFFDVERNYIQRLSVSVLLNTRDIKRATSKRHGKKSPGEAPGDFFCESTNDSLTILWALLTALLSTLLATTALLTALASWCLSLLTWFLLTRFLLTALLAALLLPTHFF